MKNWHEAYIAAYQLSEDMSGLVYSGTFEQIMISFASGDIARTAKKFAELDKHTAAIPSEIREIFLPTPPICRLGQGLG